MDDPFSPVNSEDDDVVFICQVTHYEPDEPSKPRPARPIARSKQTAFNPTNPVFYPKLKFNLTIPDGSKPWRDMPSTRDDYFNYGFTEEVWEAYKFKQNEIRKMFSSKKTKKKH